MPGLGTNLGGEVKHGWGEERTCLKKPIIGTFYLDANLDKGFPRPWMKALFLEHNILSHAMNRESCKGSRDVS